MPVAPNATAFSVCSGVSALVRTCRRVTLAHQSISVLYIRYVSLSLPARVCSISTCTISDAAVLISPAYTWPSVPLMDR
jgi:hypothetical protein